MGLVPSVTRLLARDDGNKISRHGVSATQTSLPVHSGAVIASRRLALRGKLYLGSRTCQDSTSVKLSSTISKM